MRKTNDGNSSSRGHAWLLMVYTLVTLMMLIAILFGAFIYRSAHQNDQRYSQLRSVEGFISSTFKAGDYDTDVSVEQGPEGDMLRIADADGAYETCIYLFEGRLLQEYKKADLAIYPHTATPVAELGSFEASVDGRVVTVTTDIGTFTSTLRGGGEVRR